MRQLIFLTGFILLAFYSYSQVWDENGYPLNTNENIQNSNNRATAKPVYDDNGRVTGYVKKKGNDFEVYDESMGYKGAVNDNGNSYQYNRYGSSNYRYNPNTGEYEDTRKTYEDYNNQNNSYNRDPDRFSTDTYDRWKRARKKMSALERYYKFSVYTDYTDNHGNYRLFNHYGNELEVMLEQPPKGLDYDVRYTEDGTRFYVYVVKELQELMSE